MIEANKRDAKKYLLRKTKFKVHSAWTGEEYTYIVTHSRYPGSFNVYNVDNNKRKNFVGAYMSYDGYFSVSRYEINACRLTKRAKAANIVFKNISRLDELTWLTLYIEPRCQLCGRPLKDDESIIRGYGPNCYDKIVEEQLNAKFNIGRT